MSLLATLALTTACREKTAVPVAPERPNVLLVTIDTLRADHVGCYGYQAAATPTLDALAARGVRFETAVAHSPLTGPSHASMLTGLTPLGHGFRNNSGFILAPTVKTAAEDFRQAGYRTGAVISGFPLDRRFGFDRGFDVYEDHLPRGSDVRRTPYVERPADATTDAALRWLETAGAAQGKLGVGSEVLISEQFATVENSWAQIWAHPGGDAWLSSASCRRAGELTAGVFITA